MSARAKADEADFWQGLTLALSSSVSVMAVVALAPALPMMMQAFHDIPNAAFWVPSLLSVPGLGAAFLSPFMGLLGDRFGRRKLMIASCVAFAVAGALPLILHDFTAIYISRVIVGVGQTGVLVLSTALIGDCFTGMRRDRWMSVQTMVATFAALILLPLGGVLGAWQGWRGPFWIFLAGLPLAVAMWKFCREPTRSTSGAASLAPWSSLPWRWLLGVCVISVFASILFYALQLQLGLALAAVGVADAGRIGLLSALAATGVPVGAFLFWKLNKMAFGWLLITELLICGATLTAMGFVTNVATFVVVAFCNLVGCGLILPTLATHVTSRLEPAVRGRGVGIWLSAFSTGQFLSVGVTGITVERAGATVLDALHALGLGALLIAAVACALMIVYRRRDATITAS